MICEGSTDYSLLQYYMREVYLWEDDTKKQNNVLKNPGQKSRLLTKGQDTLTIMSAGGCSRLIEGLHNALSRNKLSGAEMSDAFNKIVIVTDRDEVGTESDFIKRVQDELDCFNVSVSGEMVNNCWFKCEMLTSIGIKSEFVMLLLIIPFEDNGAMETFLLKAIAADDEYDKNIIQECEKLIDNVDPQRKYLTARRIVTKAKFDTYFSIRTPAEQFVERQNILKSVKWEEYSSIQKDFKLLAEL